MCLFISLHFLIGYHNVTDLRFFLISEGNKKLQNHLPFNDVFNFISILWTHSLKSTEDEILFLAFIESFNLLKMPIKRWNGNLHILEFFLQSHKLEDLIIFAGIDESCLFGLQKLKDNFFKKLRHQKFNTLSFFFLVSQEPI